MRTIKIGFLVLLAMLTLNVSAHAADVTYCTVTTEGDYAAGSDRNYSGYLRYWLEEVIDNGWSQCAPPTGSSDKNIGEFGAMVLFETAELPSTKNVEKITLDRAINVKNLGTEVAVGNWTPDMLTDSSSEVDYTGYASFTKDYGNVVIDGRTNLDADEQPFKCDDGERNVILRNVILNTNGIKKADVACVQDGGAYQVCEGVLVERTTSKIAAGTLAGSLVLGANIAGIRNGSSLTNTSATYTVTRILNDKYGCEITKYREICGDNLDNDGDGEIDENCETPATDADGDGSDSTEDCDDNDATRFPGNPEICDGIDNNCDGVTDEGVTTTYYADADGDTYGDAATSQAACSQPTGYVTDSTDCNDTDATVNPLGVEICDGVDNDCDGSIDEDLTTATYYTDADGDTYGDAASSTTACSQPTGTVTDSSDCSDSDATVHPGATDSCADGIDQDCSGSDSSVSCTVTTETCDGVDNDGDGSIDEGFSDTDGDGTADCVDTETCDGIDNNGDGNIDEGFDTNDDGLADCVEFGNEQCGDGLDNDGDGFADCLDEDCASDTSCNGKGPETSCDNQTDDDGDGFTDCEDSDCGLDALCLPTDDDGDGFDTTADCDDTNSNVNPNAAESCEDTIDNNCDGTTNEGCSVGTAEVDDDGDQYCDDADGDGKCADGSLAGDCDDADATINPSATESTDEAAGMCGDDIDQNCDGIDVVCSISDPGPLNPDGAVTGGGCGCDLKANSSASGRDLVQALMALIPMLLVGFLRQRAKGNQV